MYRYGADGLFLGAILIWGYIIWPWLKEIHDHLRDRFRPDLDERLEEIRRTAESRRYQTRQDQSSWKWQDPKYGQTRSGESRNSDTSERAPLTPRERYLSVLGLSDMPDKTALQQTYRKLAKRWHPDRFANEPASQERDAAAARMREINEAYDWLMANPL